MSKRLFNIGNQLYTSDYEQYPLGEPLDNRGHKLHQAVCSSRMLVMAVSIRHPYQRGGSEDHGRLAKEGVDIELTSSKTGAIGPHAIHFSEIFQSVSLAF